MEINIMEIDPNTIQKQFFIKSKKQAKKIGKRPFFMFYENRTGSIGVRKFKLENEN